MPTRIRMTAGVVVLLCGIAGARAQPALADAALVAELTALENRLATTWTAGDCDAWNALLAPEWSVIHLSGEVITRAEALAMCRKPPGIIHSQTYDQIAVRAYGDVADATP